MKERAFLAAIGALAVIGCAAPAPPDYAAQHKPAVDAYVAGWNEGKFDTFDAILTADFKRRAPAEMNADGIEGIKKVMTDLRTAYPDGKVVIDESYYLKDVSFHLWTHTGTNTGPGPTPPTGKSVKNSGMTLIRYRDGKIAEEQVRFDVMGWNTQLGWTLTPPAEPASE